MIGVILLVIFLTVFFIWFVKKHNEYMKNERQVNELFAAYVGEFEKQSGKRFK